MRHVTAEQLTEDYAAKHTEYPTNEPKPYTLDDAARARGTTADRLDRDRLTPYEVALIEEGK